MNKPNHTIRNILILIWLCVLLGYILVNHLVINKDVDSPRVSLISTVFIHEGMEHNKVINLLGGPGEDIGSGIVIERYATLSGSIIQIGYIPQGGPLHVSYITVQRIDRSVIFLCTMLTLSLVEFIVYCFVRKKSQAI